MTALRLAAAALVAAGGILATAAPAAAVCEPVIYELTGRCESPCRPLGIAYRIVQENVDGLPSLECAA